MLILLAIIDWVDLSSFLTNITGYSLVLPLVIGLFRYKFFGKELKILLIFLLLATLFEFSTLYLAQAGISNLFLIAGYILVEFLFIILIYRQAYHNDSWRKGLTYAFIAQAVILLINGFYGEGLDSLNSFTRSAESVFVIVMALAWFYQLLTGIPIKYIYKEPMFWISCGLLFYFAGNLFGFIIGNYLLRESQNYLIMTLGLHAVLFIVRNIIFTIGIWTAPQT